MSIERSTAVVWDGEQLSGWLMIEGVPVKCTADLATIHSLTQFNDVLSWEIDRFRVEIFEKLSPLLVERAIEAA